MWFPLLPQSWFRYYRWCDLLPRKLFGCYMWFPLLPQSWLRCYRLCPLLPRSRDGCYRLLYVYSTTLIFVAVIILKYKINNNYTFTRPVPVRCYRRNKFTMQASILLYEIYVRAYKNRSIRLALKLKYKSSSREKLFISKLWFKQKKLFIGDSGDSTFSFPPLI